MLNELCDICGFNESDHQGLQAERAANLLIMEQVANQLPSDYRQVLTEILVDWRTHSFPACDPLAID